MISLKFKKGDQVKILTGKDKGKTGKILEVRRNDGKVVVEGISLITRHRRPRKSNEKGQKLVKPAAVNASNVVLVCGNCGKTTRIAFEVADTGVKNRICRHCKRTV